MEWLSCEGLSSLMTFCQGLGIKKYSFSLTINRISSIEVNSTYSFIGLT